MEIMLTADVMFANQVPFLIVLGWQIGIVTTEYLPEQTAKHIAKALLRMFHNQCNKVGDELPNSIINTMALKKYFAEVEYYIQVNKK